jgi:glucokinase
VETQPGAQEFTKDARVRDRLPGALVLAADVGGTKTVLALAPLEPGAPPSAERRVPSADWPDFESLAADFLASAGHPALAAAAIAAAGPVEEGAVALTNLPWRLETARLARALGTPRVALLNDLAAAALGMLELPESAFVRLQGDALRREGTVAVIAAGTGLGEATLVFDADSARALPSEGGHAAFAPRDARESALRDRLAGPDGHVPVEAVVSGPGLVRIHEFLRAQHPGAPALRDPAAVAQAAQRGDPLAAEALALFLSCYGAEAGDLALRCVAHGGVWLGGGIAPKLLPALRGGGFLEAFRAKGRFRAWLSQLPVAVCTAEDAPLRGALREARRSVA